MKRLQLVTKPEAAILFAAVILLAALSLVSARDAFTSAEVQFADSSMQGLAIVPASCPSNPHPANQCDDEEDCTPYNLCSGNNIINSCTGAVINTCPYGCSSGACLPPPNKIIFVPFTDDDGDNASGHLAAKPALVRVGSPTFLYWNALYTQSCTVTGSNGDSFSGGFSGTSGRQTSAIASATTFTLNCTALEGATPPSVTESITVNVVPVFQEL